MTTVTWTEEELRAFDRAVEKHSSRDQVTRISGRLELRRLIDTYGKEKCDAMWEHLEGQSK